MTLKGQCIKKIEWDIIYWPRRNNLKILFFSNLEKKLLSVLMENTLIGEKVLIIEHHENPCISLNYVGFFELFIL